MAARNHFAGNVLVLAVGVVAGQEADASVTNGTLSVSLTIQASCMLSGTPTVAFGTQGVLTANTDAT